MSGAYYNEHDPFAADWLERLIGAGHIAPGTVDRRDIRDVRPDELGGFTQCHFFAGIGGWSYALRLAGWPDDRPVWTGSCPCQPFSAAGRSGGFADERHLWPHWFWNIEQHRPGVIFGEQVSSKDGLAWFDLVSTDLEGTGYAVGALDTCAAGVGAPHIRQRLFFVAESESEQPHRSGEAGRGRRQFADGGAGELGNADDARSQGHRGFDTVSIQEKRQGTKRYGSAPGLHDGELEHAPRDGRLERRAEPSGRSASSGRGESSMVNAESEQVGLPRRARQPRGTDTGGMGVADSARSFPRDEAAAPDRYGCAAIAAGWANCDWLPCTDGKARPVEPGTFPLAHGIPGRVGRLRAYGNAIVPQVAAEFIKAYLECR